MRESALWKKLKRCVPLAAMAARIENSAGEGMPDVLITYRGKTVLIELKADSEISAVQADWHRRWAEAGGESWFLIQRDSRLYLRRGNQSTNYRIRDCHEAIAKIFKTK